MRRYPEPRVLPCAFLGFFASTRRCLIQYGRASYALLQFRAARSVRVADLHSLLADPAAAAAAAGVLVVLRGPAYCRAASADQTTVPSESRSLVHAVFSLVDIFSLPSDTHMDNDGRVPVELVPLAFVEGDQRVNVTSDSRCSLPRDLVKRLMPAYQFMEYPVTLLKEEESVPIVMELTALGICRNLDGVLKIELCRQLPYFLSDMTKDEIEVSLTTSTKNYYWAAILFGVFTTVILSSGYLRND